MKTVFIDLDLPGTPEEQHAYAEALARAIAPAVRQFVTSRAEKCLATILLMRPKADPPPSAKDAAEAYKSKLPGITPSNDPIIPPDEK